MNLKFMVNMVIITWSMLIMGVSHQSKRQVKNFLTSEPSL